MPSFDVVSVVQVQEVVNAVDQVKREITTRYDFKDSKSSVEFKEKEMEIHIHTDDNMKLKAVQELLKQKLAKRNVSLKSCEFEDPTPAGGDTLRQLVKVKQGLKEEELKKINKSIKEKGLKVNSQIQGDQLRVMGKKKDDLQDVIQHLRTAMSDMSLQFINFRD